MADDTKASNIGDGIELPGTGDTTPKPAEAAKEREEATREALVTAADTEYDPHAHRDPVRNADDAITATAGSRHLVEDEEGVEATRMTAQVAQFDESGGGSVFNALAFPPKRAKIAEEASVFGGEDGHGRNRSDRREADVQREADARAVGSTDTAAGEDATEKKPATRQAAARKASTKK